jgi:transcriptional regulator with PAS, ATPase and Fis domain
MVRPSRQIDVVFEPILQSSKMRQLDQVLKTVAPKDVIITLVGESGTGKEVLARRVHESSGRRQGPFIPVNCAAVPDALFESEFFGHERGAFTGATERVRGKIEAAEGGTLFLDEIGEMPISMQAKLLRFLESRRFMRVGGSTKHQADVRLLFATLRPLDEEVRVGRFRPDLYYRIQGITLRVPPLQERKGDILPLVARFLAQLSGKHGTTPPRLTRAARAAFVLYEWPGNVRELRNVIESLCLLREGKQIRSRDLPECMRAQRSGGAAQGAQLLSVDLAQPLDRSIERIIEAALALEQGNRSRTAERLGISVRTIQRYLAKGGVVEAGAASESRRRGRQEGLPGASGDRQ